MLLSVAVSDPAGTSDDRATAVDVEDLTRDEAGPGRGQEEDGTDHLVQAPEAPGRLDTRLAVVRGMPPMPGDHDRAP